MQWLITFMGSQEPARQQQFEWLRNWIQENAKEAVGDEEYAPATGNIHIHFAVKLKKRLRWS